MSTEGETRDLLVALGKSGIAVWAEGDKLRLRGPPGALTEALRAAVTLHRAALFDLLSERTRRSDSLVVLHPGLSREPPLFCFHTLHGGAWDYRYLASYLPETVRVVGVQALGSWLGRDRFTRLDEVAGYYAQQLLDEWPHGPFRLFGASAGGLIALHAAIELSQRGCCVDYLGVADTFDSSYYRGLPAGEADRVFWISFVEAYLPRPVMEIAQPQHPFWGLSDDEKLRLLVSLAVVSGTDAAGPIDIVMARTASDAMAFRDYCQLYFSAVVPAFSGQMTYIRSAASQPEWSTEIRRAAVLGTKEFVVPGHHLDVIRPPGVKRVASILSATLQGAGTVATRLT